MTRLAPKLEVIRALFARSGNQCAFPGCVQPLVNHKNQLIGQVCHIEAATPGGERYNQRQTDEERRDYKNLLLLCYPHHVETNDVNEFPVERIISIKLNHESIFEKSDFKIDEPELTRLVSEMEKYWENVERLNSIEHSFEELAFRVNAKDSFFDLIESARGATVDIENLLDRLHQSDHKLLDDFNDLLSYKNIDPDLFLDIPYYQNTFKIRNWEDHNIATPNLLNRLRIDLVHIEVKYLEEYLKTSSNDLLAKDRLDRVKITLTELAQYAIHVD
ncbi:hypothetical protein [Chamaesiphon sp. OTE_8_metabat_110]|uniref:hypothetical protein n=1 Tax=Chamaesiphon sp. OTE_8_metabat_110 TaxID=2964696 RepID=UPI00286BD835|nr:hypothetical protein [Chamaesiphon sp. OTE_8_metabat_110]